MFPVTVQSGTKHSLVTCAWSKSQLLLRAGKSPAPACLWCEESSADVLPFSSVEGLLLSALTGERGTADSPELPARVRSLDAVRGRSSAGSAPGIDVQARCEAWSIPEMRAPSKSQPAVHNHAIAAQLMHRLQGRGAHQPLTAH